MKQLCKALLLLICVSLFAGLLTTSSRAYGKEGKTQPPSIEPAYKLSDFIDIYLEKDVDNIKPRVAYNLLHDEYFVVWTNIRGGGAAKDIYARRLKADRTLSPVFAIISDANAYNYDPDVVYNPLQDEYLVVWTYDVSPTDSDIWARRVTWNGAKLDQPQYQKFQISRPGDTGDKQINPAVTYNSKLNEYLVVYENAFGTLNDIDAIRIQAADGSQVDWANVATGAFEYRRSPDVSYHPASDSYLIAYTYESNLIIIPEKIVSRLVSRDLSNLGSETEICEGNDPGNVSIAASDEGFITVWDQDYITAWQVKARRFSPDGIPLTTDGFDIEHIDYNHAPDVGYGGGRYLVVYQTASTSNTSTDYYVHGFYTAVGADERIGSEIHIDRDGDSQMNPAVACSPVGDCLVVEQDRKTMKGDYEIRGRLLIRPRYIYLPLITQPEK
jgi:hypothetical protein